MPELYRVDAEVFERLVPVRERPGMYLAILALEDDFGRPFRLIATLVREAQHVIAAPAAVLPDGPR